MPRSLCLTTAAALAALTLVPSTIFAAPKPAATPPPDGSVMVPDPGLAFEPRIPVGNVDPEAFSEWFDGQEKKMAPNMSTRDTVPRWPVWTDKAQPAQIGVTFGISAVTGPRHMRIGLKEAVPVGTLVVRGGGKVSVLKPGASYPGNMADESQWISGERLVEGEISEDEADRKDYALWVFPPGTTTRVMRFSHVPDPSDNKFEGWLGAVLVLKDRMINVAPLATASASSTGSRAYRVANEESDDYSSWSNHEDKVAGLLPVISPEHPEWLILTWPQAVKITGLWTIWTGFGSAEVQTYAGPATQHPRDAKEKDWQTVGKFSDLKSGNLVPLWPNRLDFGKEIATRAVRLRITSPIKQGVHMNTAEGSRTWLSELMALQSLGSSKMQPVSMPSVAEGLPKPPVPVRFTLKEPGFVSLVIEKKDGFRVRNLISETWFPAGENVAWWDGLDDLGRDTDAAKHGLYKVPARFVEVGDYRVRGLVRGAIDPRYEFSVYANGTPPWSTADHTGAWLANHTPPMSAVFVPEKQSPTGTPTVFLGCYVTEGPDGMAWVDLEGKKLGGKKWIGGIWTAAPFMARDAGPKAAPGVSVYVASVWETEKKSGEGELRISALSHQSGGNDKALLTHPIGKLVTGKSMPEIGGIAVHDGLAVVSLPLRNQLLLVDVTQGKVVGEVGLESPKGLAFDAQGRLNVLSGTKLVRFSKLAPGSAAAAPQVVVSTGLEAPWGVTADSQGSIYISDRGASHQVKLFNADGKFVRAIGKPGAPKAGPYDPLHLNNPAGIAVDSRQQLWVTENDYLPKRVSVWSMDGKLLKAFYGPGKYGGGGSLDPRDRTKFYYAEERGAMEFKLDWEKGTSEPVTVYFRSAEGDQKLGFRSAAPETVLYRGSQRYFTNCYNSSPTAGHPTAFLFIERDGIARPIAAMGGVDYWEFLKGDEFKSRWPEGIDLNGKGEKNDAYFAWVDANEDAQAQPEEVTFRAGPGGGVSVLSDLSFVFARAANQTLRVTPTGFSKTGVPNYDLTKAEVLAKDVMGPGSSGGNQAIVGPNGWVALTLGMAPFEQYSFSGAQNGVPKWSYPNMWPGLHASHHAPQPRTPGQMSGPTRLLGDLFEPKGSGAGPLWAVNGNHGTVYVFTTDGLFVATLFKDMRAGKKWGMPVAERNMKLDSLTLGQENFWPSISQGADGKVYLVDGARSSLVRLDGLETVKRLPDGAVSITKSDLEKCRTYLVESESLRQRAQGTGRLEVALRNDAPVVDGKTDDWNRAEWVDIDLRGTRANFNSTNQAYDVSGAVAVAGDRLYAVYRTNDDKILLNSGEMPIAPFKTGGALDLMIGADPAAKPDRRDPVAGDVRLVVTMVKKKPWALLYRAVVPGTKPVERVPFSSPDRTVMFDKVEDVTAQLKFAVGEEGTFEFSIPLATLGLKPAPELSLKGDMGVLRGSEGQTSARIYWANKATGIVSDVPAEATLTPALWGTFHFTPGK